MQGIIIENIADLYKVTPKILKPTTFQTKNIVSYDATARGKLKKQEMSPVVGDFVEFEITDEKNKKAVINKILPRKVFVKRPKLANITQMIFVISSKNPKPDLLMLDKQLAFAEFLGISSLIVLNKTDLDDKEELEEIQEIYEKIGYKVFQTQAKNHKGLNLVKKALQNHVNAFSGNSGVGKSTLINGIFEKNITQEGEISQRNKRGKNTTTAIKLYEIDTNTYIADTPGFSTFSIEEIKSKELANFFIEFKQKCLDCEFVGCTHIKEENCGIKKAIQKGEINLARYDRFCKIYQQIKKEEEKRKW